MTVSLPNNLNAQAGLGFDTVKSYNDLNALQAIKYGDRADASRLDAVAQQFESMFVSMMLKGMRSANEAFGKDNPLNSSNMRFYQEMYDSELAVSLSQAKGIGIAEVVKRQLAGRFNAEGKTAPDPLKTAQSIASYERRDLGNPYALAEAITRVDELIQGAEKPLGSRQTLESVQTHSFSESSLGDRSDVAQNQKPALPSVDFSTPESYIESLLPIAKKIEQYSGIDARIMLAQSALETGWGKYQIMKADGQPSHNLFGIKAHNAWQGDQAEILTTEFRGGVAMKERAAFRSYRSYEESFKDYAKFLQSNQRYEQALMHRDNPKAFANALQASGYATDPEYGAKIGRILDQYLPSNPKLTTTTGG